ncbi:hypothetical protein [Acetobacter persici]|uniref:hypothetical protein n=1 Tax=Acetobacter persici TaxID=1076596 RepID=UPI001BA90074|nr:hypothetical protein [Acetobacter persici]
MSLRSYGLISESTGTVVRVRESLATAVQEARRLASAGGPIIVLGCHRKIRRGDSLGGDLDGQFIGRFRGLKRERYGKKVPAGIVCAFH